MKTLCASILLISFNLTLIAQIEFDVTKNMNYFNEVVSDVESKNIKKIQNIVANYDITNADGFNSKKSSTYDVIFKKYNCKILTTYDSEGKILNSNEVYTDMRLPISLMKQILKENKKWYVSSNIQTIKYHHKKNSYKLYQIELRMDNKIKQLKFKTNTKNNNKSYVVSN
ncbi:hypothetical protein [Winogradskyella sp. PG-2]|uniref:hypothetical protein n=1 Tax=Winogradskyella sp. PG-2 TaxID=754409 RepID=UPI000458835A|nr:hypothetical protein [Winogradskyella sp. PG-2]BAO77360.1 hypothetical protein WPG_3130 [Winogradskyella sp. PG-2]